MKKDIIDILDKMSVEDILKYLDSNIKLDDIKLTKGGDSLYKSLKIDTINDDDTAIYATKYNYILENDKIKKTENNILYLCGIRIVHDCINDYREFTREIGIRKDLLIIPHVKFIFLKALYYKLKVRIWDVDEPNPINSNARIYAIVDIKEKKLNKDKPHVVLWNLVSASNLGKIERSAFAFGIKDIALVNTKRNIINNISCTSSRRACFYINYSFYDNIDEYIEEFKEHKLYNMMLSDKSIPISKAVENLHTDLYSIV